MRKNFKAYVDGREISVPITLLVSDYLPSGIGRFKFFYVPGYWSAKVPYSITVKISALFVLFFSASFHCRVKPAFVKWTVTIVELLTFICLHYSQFFRWVTPFTSHNKFVMYLLIFPTLQWRKQDTQSLYKYLKITMLLSMEKCE